MTQRYRRAFEGTIGIGYGVESGELDGTCGAGLSSRGNIDGPLCSAERNGFAAAYVGTALGVDSSGTACESDNAVYLSSPCNPVQQEVMTAWQRAGTGCQNSALGLTFILDRLRLTFQSIA